MSRHTITTGACLLLAALLLMCAACQKRHPLIDKKCGTCHATAVVYEKKRPAAEWDRIVFAMKARGLTITAREEAQLIEFLHTDLASP
jgi:hypothetical protein